jgi:hypothetical protein
MVEMTAPLAGQPFYSQDAISGLAPMLSRIKVIDRRFYRWSE